jgi:hypothetical protein
MSVQHDEKMTPVLQNAPLSTIQRVGLVLALAVCTFLAVVGSILIAQQPGGSLGKTVAVPGGCFLKIFSDHPSIRSPESNCAEDP